MASRPSTSAGGGWSAITDGNGDVTGTVFALAPDGAGGAWVGGYFADVDGIPTADYVAHWTGGTTWTDLGGIALNGTVRGLAASGTGVIVAGDFTNAGAIGGRQGRPVRRDVVLAGADAPSSEVGRASTRSRSTDRGRSRRHVPERRRHRPGRRRGVLQRDALAEPRHERRRHERSGHLAPGRGGGRQARLRGRPRHQDRRGRPERLRRFVPAAPAGRHDPDDGEPFGGNMGYNGTGAAEPVHRRAARRDRDVHAADRERRRRRRHDHAQGAGLGWRLHGHLARGTTNISAQIVAGTYTITGLAPAPR